MTGSCSDNLTLMHSEQPKLHRVLAVLSALGLNWDSEMNWKEGKNWIEKVEGKKICQKNKVGSQKFDVRCVK